MSQPQRNTVTALAIREMLPKDISAVRELAHRVWRTHYPAMIPEKQIDYMLDLMYAPQSLKSQMAQGHIFWLAYEGNALAGFVSVEPQGQAHWHMHKLYVDQEQAPRGTGSDLVRHILRTLRPKKITLTVNRKNVKAINFYFKHGFIIDHVLDKDIGSGFVMKDFVMRWQA